MALSQRKRPQFSRMAKIPVQKVTGAGAKTLNPAHTEPPTRTCVCAGKCFSLAKVEQTAFRLRVWKLASE